MRYTKIEQLSFAFITDDLFRVEEFARDSLCFEIVQIGNRGFQLFDDADLIYALDGLTFSKDALAKEKDRANLRTLVHLF